MLELLENARINGNTPTFAPKAQSPPASTRPSSLSCVLDILCICTIYMYLLDVSIRYLKYFCVLFVLFVFLFMLLASLRCYTSIFDGFILMYPPPSFTHEKSHPVSCFCLCESHIIRQETDSESRMIQVSTIVSTIVSLHYSESSEESNR